MNKIMALAALGRARGNLSIKSGDRARHTGSAPERVIRITVGRVQYASPWKQQANFRVERNPGGKSSASGRIFTHGLFPLLIPALTDGHIAVSASYKLGWNLCR
jgi:hypothetical protein